MRLIPTCVGSTASSDMSSCLFTAHPHVCGEHHTRTGLTHQRRGSSPRVWGALTPRSPTNSARRLIPTCVGSTSSPSPQLWTATAHPHVCGEHFVCQPQGRYEFGSSPRVWGARFSLVTCGVPFRLIPTCVGSTFKQVPIIPKPPAHPHVCGEHWYTHRSTRWQEGSSPRVWGALGEKLVIHSAHRLIPTCVGSTLADMGFYPHTPSFRISLEPKASINPTRFLGLSPSGSAPIPASFAPPFSWP